MNLASGFAQQGIIHRRHQRLVRLQGPLHRQANLVKDRRLIKPIVRIKTVIGRPMLLVAVLGAQQGADRVTTEADQVGQAMAADLLKTLSAGKGIGRSARELFQTMQHKNKPVYQVRAKLQ